MSIMAKVCPKIISPYGTKEAQLLGLAPCGKLREEADELSPR